MLINVVLNTCLLVTCFLSKGLALTYLATGFLWTALQIDSFRSNLELSILRLPKKKAKTEGKFFAFGDRVLISGFVTVLALIALLTVLNSKYFEKIPSNVAEVVQQPTQSRTIAKENCEWVREDLEKFLNSYYRENDFKKSEIDKKILTYNSAIQYREEDWESFEVSSWFQECNASISEKVVVGPERTPHIVDIKIKYDQNGKMTSFHEIPREPSAKAYEEKTVEVPPQPTEVAIEVPVIEENSQGQTYSEVPDNSY